MSVLQDFSLMDILFDREENLKLDKEIKTEDIKTEPDDRLQFSAINDYWQKTSDDILDSILFNDQNFDLISENELLQEEPVTDATSSAASDSGVSSDQQMSPISSPSYGDEVEEDSETPISDLLQFSPSKMINVVDDDSNEPPLARRPRETNSKPVVRVKPSISKTSAKVIHVPPAGSNSRSILLPMGVKASQRNYVRTVKIVKPAGRGVKHARIKAEPIDDDDVETGYPPLLLTEEERKLIIKEGISLPTHYPLTKEEERELKRIRRKIRNKISAQDSRKRKKEYVDGLEDRVKQCSVENAQLLKKMKALQQENQCLSAQLKKIQAALASKTVPVQQAQPSTCLMVLVLSLALLMAPNMRSSRPATQSDIKLPADVKDSSSSVVAGRSRTLLEYSKSEGGFVEVPIDEGASEDEESENVIYSDLAELLQFRATPSQHDHDYTANSASRKRVRSHYHSQASVDDNWPPPKRPLHSLDLGSVQTVRTNHTEASFDSDIMIEILNDDSSEAM